MQARLNHDPYEALGLIGSPTPADIRQAFLTLTKKFHPARFGRMAPDIQRLANEVFLALRAAHDTLARPVAPKPRPASTSMAMPRTITASSGPVYRPTSPPQNKSDATQTLRPQGGQAPPPPMPRTVTATGSAHRVGAPQNQGTQPVRTTTTPPATGQTSPPRAKFPVTTPATVPGVSPTLRPPMSAPGSLPPTGGPARTHPAPAAATVQARQSIGSQPPPAQQADPELAPILALLEHGQFAACRVALETLVARSPNVARYRALIAYTKGREAQHARRIDDARVELQEALQIDPGLELAKTALGELFSRRK